MNQLWAFLSDPNNQKTLAWIGGGVVIVAGGLWTVVTFFARRKRDVALTTPAPTIRVIASRGGMAAGRDQIVTALPSRSPKGRRRRAR